MFRDHAARAIIAATIILLMPGSVRASQEAKEVSMSLIVKAKPYAVWEAIRGQRRKDKEHRKLISYHDNEATIEEQFPSLPIVGAATCLYKEYEVPLQRIDYRMVSSNQFKQFEGSWVLTPVDDGNNTLVNLSSRLDPGLRVPFWKEITKAATTKHIKERLSSVRHDAEEIEHEVAVSIPHPQ